MNRPTHKDYSSDDSDDSDYFLDESSYEETSDEDDDNASDDDEEDDDEEDDDPEDDDLEDDDQEYDDQEYDDQEYDDQEDDDDEESDDDPPIGATGHYDRNKLLRLLRQWNLQFPGVEVQEVPTNPLLIDIIPLIPLPTAPMDELIQIHDYPWNENAPVVVHYMHDRLYTTQWVRRFVTRHEVWGVVQETKNFTSFRGLLRHLTKTFQNFYDCTNTPIEPSASLDKHTTRTGDLHGPSNDDVDKQCRVLRDDKEHYAKQ